MTHPAGAVLVQQNVEDFIIIFTSILYEAMPFIVLGAVIAGMLEELVPQQLDHAAHPEEPAARDHCSVPCLG